MTNIVLKSGDIGVDISGFRIDTDAKVKQFHDAGGKFTIRYSAGIASDPKNSHFASVKWKLCSPGEFVDLIAIGDLFANDEWYEKRVAEGSRAGHDDGLAAGAFWHRCGLAKGAAIYPSMDAQPSRSLWPQMDAYDNAYRQAITQWGYVLGEYAGTPYLVHAIGGKIIKFGWRPNAGSWSNDGIPYQPDLSTQAKRDAFVKSSLGKTPASIVQTGNYWFGKNADENILLRVPCGSHWEAVAANKPAPTPTPTPTPTSARYPAGPTVSPNGQYKIVMGNGGHIQVHDIHTGNVRYL